MTAITSDLRKKAQAIIERLYGKNAQFRKGQYEAIEATLSYKRTLVVQKTGWGKSLVYFISTKLLRDYGKGLTLIVSPLLVLMDNQVEAAKQLGLRCDVLNSGVKDRWDSIIDEMARGKLDLLLITPETLLSDRFRNRPQYINFGLFVVDEAHCISDWGHDFRLEYTRLSRVVSKLPMSVPLLATTATASNRVIKDLVAQFGGSVHVSRGPLMRESLSIQLLDLADNASRYAWILQNINRFPGSGIIYCLTKRDADHLADFLQKNNVGARSYFSREREEDVLNDEAEKLFKENKIKALVATVKLGMGYDKDDISFVIHYQHPSNIVAYYQQIGRAGRNIPRAYTFLMYGPEDIKIQNYFIDTAFPTRDEAEKVSRYILENNDKGSSRGEIMANVNVKYVRILKALKFLENEEYIYRSGSKYYTNPKPFKYNEAHYKEVTLIRKKEQEQMRELIGTDVCYSRFVVNALDDDTDENCGKCSNCLGFDEFSPKVEKVYLDASLSYLEKLLLPIEPRKKWATTSLTKQTKIAFQIEEGICLSKYGDPGYGTLVKNDKFSKNQRFSDELVGKSVRVLRPIVLEKEITGITYVPSLRSRLVEDFARRLADGLRLDFVCTLEKSKADQQKNMQNTSFQCDNALKSFKIIKNVQVPKRLILVDDLIDSRWTMVVCGYRLMEAGCEMVFPYALASSSLMEDDKHE